VTDAAAFAGIELATDGLGFVYPDGTRALSDVSLTIGAGSRVAIVGQNGSGKSTLVRHFNGLLRATEGHVLVDGQPVGRTHVADLARLVGISFQNPDRQIFSGNVRAEIAFGPKNIGLRGPDLERRVNRALMQVGLTQFAETNPYDLGFSERKLLALASIIAMGTPAIVLDEPTTGQDARTADLVTELAGRLRGDGVAVVCVSHDMALLARVADRVVAMAGGTIVADGPARDVFADEAALRTAGLVAPQVTRLARALAPGDPRPVPIGVDELVARLRAERQPGTTS